MQYNYNNTIKKILNASKETTTNDPFILLRSEKHSPFLTKVNPFFVFSSTRAKRGNKEEAEVQRWTQSFPRRKRF